MKDSVQIAVFCMLQHLSFVIGIVTIDFSSIGYIDQSIVLQCKDTDNITVSRANWYQGGTLLDLSSSRYNQTALPDGFSLKISSLRSTDGGVYHCGIEFGTSSTKTLTIYYNTVEKDVEVKGNITTRTIAITIIAFPDPVYNINVTQDQNLTYVNWNVTKTTKTNGAIEVLLQNSTAFQDKIYTVVVTITSPVNLVVTSNVSFVQTTATTTPSTTKPPAPTITSVDFITSSSVAPAYITVMGNSSVLSTVVTQDTVALSYNISYSNVLLSSMAAVIPISVTQNGNASTFVTFVDVVTLYTMTPYYSTGYSNSSVTLIDVGTPSNVTASYNTGYSTHLISQSAEDVNTEAIGGGVGGGGGGALLALLLGVIFYRRFRKNNWGIDVTIILPVSGSVNSGEDWIGPVWIGPQGKSLTSNRKYTILPYDSKTGTSSLIIKYVSIIDSGSYSCQSNNGSGTPAQASITITAHEPVGNDVTITLPVSRSVNSGGDWTGPQKKQLTSNGKYSISPYDSKTGKSSLTIKNLSMADSGSYSCQSKNGSGIPAQVSITFKPHEKFVVNVDTGEALLRQHGSDLKVICSGFGNGNIRVDWTEPKGNRLTGIGKYSIVPYDRKTKKSFLTIGISSMTNSECYICRAMNESGVSAEAYITVTVHANGSLAVSIDKIICSVPVSENLSREWIGPQKNTLANTGKYTIVPYDSTTKKSSLTVTNLSSNDNGSYTCQATNSSGSSAENFITIIANDTPTEQRVNRVQIIYDEGATSPTPLPVHKKENKTGSTTIHTGTQNKVESETSNILTKPFDQKECRSLPPLSVELKDKPNHRPQPPPPVNSDVKDQNMRGLSANYDDTRGLATETPRSSRLPPLLAPVQPTVEEVVALEEPKKRKKKKKKKDQMNERNPADEMTKLKRKRKSSECQVVSDEN